MSIRLRTSVARITLLFLLLAAVVGCQPVTLISLSSTLPPPELTPYHTRTPTHAPLPSTLAPDIQLSPVATATPFTHAVVEGETMLGIAFQYGITLEELQSANPTVDPRFLVVGTALLIPLGGEIPQSLPAPTPLPLSLQSTRCYKAADGGLWCFLLARNEQPVAMENLSAWIGLFDDAGQLLASQVAFSSVNLLKPGGAIPLVAFFPSPVEDYSSVQAEMLTALAVPDPTGRYLDAHVSVDTLQISESGLSAMVNGQIILADEISPGGSIWIVLVAYDKEDQVVGVRKWQANDAGLFAVDVFSLGPDIQRVDVLVEARPAPDFSVTLTVPE
ncbi:MAG: LysM peptidoglycan-binding domain-containing protein [Anaerolineales bacterium]|nr:LysM peptidoglycan-binding domain-containing protein [Anaerolineales bacterium]